MPCWRSWLRSDLRGMRQIARHSRPGRAAAVLGIILSTTLVSGARAEDAVRDAAYRRLNRSLVEHHVLPRYVRLADSTAALDVAARRLCRPETAPLDEVRKAFHAASDAWHDASTSGSGPWNPGSAPSASTSGRIPATRRRGSSASSAQAVTRRVDRRGLRPGECRR